MPVIAWIAIFSLLGSAGFIARAGALLPAKEQWRCCLLPRLVSYAVGMLLGAALLGMLPRVLEGAQGGAVLSATLLGLVVFFIPEKVRLVAARPRGGVRHSFLGGAAGPDRGCVSELCGGLCHRGSLFGLGPLATSTSLPVIAREIPQELGDFGILLEGGYARSRALVYSLLSSTTVPGGADHALCAFSVPRNYPLRPGSFCCQLHRHGRRGLDPRSTPADQPPLRAAAACSAAGHRHDLAGADAGSALTGEGNLREGARHAQGR